MRNRLRLLLQSDRARWLGSIATRITGWIIVGISIFGFCFAL
jgi:hypothetical protein